VHSLMQLDRLLLALVLVLAIRGSWLAEYIESDDTSGASRNRLRWFGRRHGFASNRDLRTSSTVD
jgi:hypothetical protein